MVRFSDARDWHTIQSEYQPRFGIWWVTVYLSGFLHKKELQATSKIRTVRISNGHFSDTFSVRISDAFEIRTQVFLTSSLDRFVMNKMFL
jgi:hypothetical protein